MGYQPTNLTTTLTAKLTPLGRQLLVTNTNNLITKFALGDSDANYNTSSILSTGEIPSLGGNVGPNGTNSNSTGNDTAIKYPLNLNDLGSNLKNVDPSSINVTNVISKNGQILNLSGSNITQITIDRNDLTTDPMTNLFVSFGLPITESQKNTYTATTFNNGGFSDTAFSGFANDKIVVISIDNSQYGENLDGKEIKLTFVNTASTFTIYGTFQNKNLSLNIEDSNYKDTSRSLLNLGKSVSLLVSDDIMTPNGGDITKSWATGFGATKPFSVGRKSLINLQTNSNLSLTADTAVGIAYLDKGLLVLTHPTLVNDFDESFSGNSGASITFNSVSTNVIQNITCIANRGEFFSSTNPTWSIGDTVRISELGLYDNQNRLIAYGKFDRQVEKTKEMITSFGIKITV
jgi:hypothetical protein